MVHTKGKGKVLVNLDGFKTAHGVWSPRASKETYAVRDVLEIR